MNKTGKGGAKRGEVRNPNGRPSLLPEVRALAEEQRNVVKTTLARLFKMTAAELDKHSRDKNLTAIEKLLIKFIERVDNDGDVKNGKELIEIVTGKLVDEAPVQALSPDEQLLLDEYRRRMAHPRLEAPDGESQADRR